MENSLSAPVQPIEQCTACFKTVLTDDVYCPDCGYPLKGTEAEQRNFTTARDFRDIDLATSKKMVKRAGNALYYLAGLFILYAVVSFFVAKDNPEVLAIVIPYLILAILFLVLGAFSSKKPLMCFVSGLCLYIILQVLFIVDNPEVLIKGIIFKIAIIAYLIKGIKSAIDLEKIKKENNIA
jgi:hypothetical protein